VKAERRRNNVGRKRIGHATKKAHALHIKGLNRQHKPLGLVTLIISLNKAFG